MEIYPDALLMALTGVAAYLGLEALVLAAVVRRRAHLLLGLLGLAGAAYCYLSLGLYTSVSVEAARAHQMGQLAVGAVMLVLAVCLGLDFAGKLGRWQAAMVALPAVLAVALLPVGHVGLSDQVTTRILPLSGRAYHELLPGPATLAFFAFALCAMVAVTVHLGARARRVGGPSWVVLGVYVMWLAMTANDMLVSAGMVASIYLAEVAFLGIVVIMALVQHRDQVRRGYVAQTRSRELEAEVVAFSRELADAQAELQEAERLAEVGRLASGVAHEINNPLTFVRGNLELVARELEGDEELYTLLADAQEGVSRIHTVVQQLYGLSRLDEPQAPCRVTPVVRDLCEELAAELGDEVELVTDLTDLPRVRLAAPLLRKTVRHLVENARHATRGCAQRRITVRARTADAGAYVALCVEDTGPGVPEALLPTMFEPFVRGRGHHQGAGLGLAVIRPTMTQAGGTVHAENLPGGGARIMLRLPIEPGDTPTPKDPPAGAASDRDNGDDHPVSAPSQELPMLT